MNQGNQHMLRAILLIIAAGTLAGCVYDADTKMDLPCCDSLPVPGTFHDFQVPGPSGTDGGQSS